MRQLKFRQPIYHRDGSFREWHYWGLFESDGEWVNIAPASKHYIVDVKITDPLDSTQFTGLTDKNGVDVYEGDVVYSNGGMTCLAEWLGNYKTGTIGFYLTTPQGFNAALTPSTGNIVEVIGNIYEHPHLLNKPQNQPA